MRDTTDGRGTVTAGEAALGDQEAQDVSRRRSSDMEARIGASRRLAAAGAGAGTTLTWMAGCGGAGSGEVKREEALLLPAHAFRHRYERGGCLS